ncbi:MAG: mechanosensitive ion channel family protein [Bacteroidetes bacterium]|nr:mechanosensitive ion channel family protein [Bacteroidota bacterium]MBU1116397.1 mechanosensitive ion channel family protein [Bacteroidota bacterium]MBU1798677.1 mechanosensitive ion channel family protein [Bacteroidota bacterium]
MTKPIDNIERWFIEHPLIYVIAEFALALILAFIVYLIVHKVLIRFIQKATRKTKTEFDDILLNEKLLTRASYIVPILVFRQFSFFSTEIEIYFDNILEALVVLFVVLIINSFLDALTEIISKFEKFKARPIKGYAQVVKIIISIFAAIFIFGIISGQNFWSLFAGLGAISAVLLLVFKDTIMSFVASIQIASYDLIKVGDWIEIPSMGVDGDVMDIALHTIKVRNFDKTITTVPTNKLVEQSFKNWRGMQETGGRRIKRSIYIDVSSIKFVNNILLQKFSKFHLISEYLKSKTKEIEEYNNSHKYDFSEIVNGRRLTNIGTFREYVKAYLRNRDDIDKNLTFLVRQLSPGPEGLPIEIYVFTNTTAWVKYEEIQSDIFDHLMAVVPEFELKVFQNPTGNDFNKLKE